MSKHTPGPYTVHKRGDEVSVLGRPLWGCKWHGKKGVWPIATMESMDNDAETRSNARLIAKALNSHYQMYEALKALDDMWTADLKGPDSLILSEDTKTIWLQIRAALKAASGSNHDTP